MAFDVGLMENVSSLGRIYKSRERFRSGGQPSTIGPLYLDACIYVKGNLLMSPVSLGSGDGNLLMSPVGLGRGDGNLLEFSFC